MCHLKQRNDGHPKRPAEEALLLHRWLDDAPHEARQPNLAQAEVDGQLALGFSTGQDRHFEGEAEPHVSHRAVTVSQMPFQRSSVG